VTGFISAILAQTVYVVYHLAVSTTFSELGQFMEVAPILHPHLEAIRTICREFGVARLEVFGSVQTDKFDPETSDIDFLVEYPEGYDFGPWLRRLQDFEESLSALLPYPVDVVMTYALRREGFRLEAAETRMVVFDDAPIARVA